MRHVFADGACAGPKLQAALKRLGRWTLEIVKRPDTAQGCEVLPRRWAVERTLARLNRNRRLAKDCETAIATATAWLFLASVQLLTRRLARHSKTIGLFGPDSKEAASDDGILVSAITPWEVALLVEKGRLRLGREVRAWLESTLALPGIVLVPIQPAIAVDSVRLPGSFHADPADRLIVAMSRHRGVPLLTADRAILSHAASGHLHAVNAAK